MLLNTTTHHELTAFLRSLRKESLRNERLTINFKHTERVHSCGTLLLVAEVDRLVRAVGPRCEISCTYPKDPTVEKVFQQIGLFKLLGKEHRLEVTEEDRDVFHWKYATGVEVAPIQADPILKGIKAQLPTNFRKIVVGVEEAMDNAVHHGHIEPRGDRLSGNEEADARRWWLFAEILDDWLHVVFCDLGVGIPRSLPRSWSEEAGDIMRLALSRGKKDVRMICRSFEVGRTRTELDHRGKGLKNIAAAAKDLGGVLTVHSNAGCVRRDYRPDSKETNDLSYKRSIMGTVVQWSVPLSNA
ncbi:ATP-binding protein [Pseudomonas resinovorans]|uniref:ATP-binding protein n=1 Tax=Metapseudomonas resinovorans TaxID=53412 RepID=A0ABT4YAH2_METRE|nr:ATP-binding protein [Pseudomonas resinovorans]MDA8485872.1 ATP-binding protein [Pseudomonas resinovorans]